MNDTAKNSADTAKSANKAAQAAQAISADAAANVRELTEQGLDRAKAAYETFKESAQEAVDLLDGSAAAIKSGTTDINTKAIEYAQANFNAGFEFARRAFAAKDVKELMALQSDFAQSQIKAYTQQAQDLSKLSVKVAESASRPLADGVMKSFEQARQVFPHA
jgi:phasin